MPPAPKIPDPIPFDTWRETPVLFDRPVSASQTHVINDQSLDGTRFAYGVSSEGFWFFIEMMAAQESEFWNIFLAWRKQASGDHAFTAASVDKLPPSCGTPNTPKCPPEDDLQSARERLQERLAGPGADEAMLLAAEAKVNEMLLSTLEATLTLLEPSP